ncbi:MAG: shikimate dehydrogenase family protein [Gemmatimonadales bacterium]
MKVTAHTRVFAVLGHPVAHSHSPRMHNAGFLAAGLDAIYVALQLDADNVVSQMTTLIRAGGGGNVTIPYKLVAAEAGTRRDARVERLGSANVFAGSAGSLHVGNTDVDGVLAAVDRLGVPADAWCVVGTGGSARGVAGAAAERHVRLAIRSRDVRRAADFAAWAASIGVDPADLAECHVVINATPLGLLPTDPHPFDLARLPVGAAVLDLVYGEAGPTAWVRACRARGLRALDGRDVLVAQGAASWRFWFPDVVPPIEIMRAAVDGRLG